MLTLYTLAAFAAVLSLLAFWMTRESNRILTALALVLAAVACVLGWGQTVTNFGGLYQFDTLARGLTLVALLGGLWTLLLGPAKKFEYPLLVLYAVTGMHVMASTPNLVVMLIALEVFSLPLYVLATWQRDEKGFESGLKYFLLGALAAAVFLYGIALYFASTGSFTAGIMGSGPLYVTALMLLLAALAFKVSLVPFQWWTPDVYQGSPTVVTLFMATAVKAAAFAALLRIFTPQGLEAWGLGLAVLVALTTVFGNLGALAQTEAKRLFAYSSIAHAGYIAMGLYGPAGSAAIPFYLLVYGLATGIIFAVLSMLSNQDVPLGRLKGLWQRKPLLAGAMGLSILSLLGLPPLAGFWGKFLVFQEAAKAGYYSLMVLALITSAISAYYYLRVFFSLFAKPDPGAELLDQEADAAVARFGSSESPNVPVVGAPMALTQALMAPATRMGVGPLAILWSALLLLGLLSFLPRLGLSAFSVGLPTLTATPGLTLVQPINGSEVVAGSYGLKGIGLAGSSLELFDNGQKLGETVVGTDGNWSFELPSLPSVGAHSYQARLKGTSTGPESKVTVKEPSTELGFADPADGATVSASGFTLSGTGKPGEELEVFEDGVSLGRVTVGPDGRWSLQIPPATSGKHAYEVRRPGEATGLIRNLVVGEASGATCSQAFSLANLRDGETLSKPFRFGGVGSAKSYTVTVKRGDRVIGRKDLPLSAACGWSYLSNPGAGQITYEVRDSGTDATSAPLAAINLTIQ